MAAHATCEGLLAGFARATAGESACCTLTGSMAVMSITSPPRSRWKACVMIAGRVGAATARSRNSPFSARSPADGRRATPRQCSARSRILA